MLESAADGTGRQRRAGRWRRPGKGLWALLVLVATVAALMPFVGSGPAVAGTGTMRRLLASTIAAGSVQLSFTATVHDGSLAADLQGSGAADLVHDAASFHVTGTLGGHPQTASVVEAGDRLYLEVSQIARLVPGKAWVSVADPLPSGTGLERSAGALGRATDPGVLLSLLESAGGTVDTLGTSTLAGSPVTGYRVRLDAASLASAAGRAGLPASLVRGVDSMTVTLYAAGDLLRELQVTTAGAPALDATIGFHGYGVPVAVQAPPVTSVITFTQFAQHSPGTLSAPGALL